MQSLTDWFCANKLSLNVLKTNFVVFKPKRITQIHIDTLKLGDQTIQEVLNSLVFTLMMNWSGVIILNLSQRKQLVVHIQSDLPNDSCLWTI